MILSFCTRLRGIHEVPPVSTNATGSAMVTWEQTLEQFFYRFTVYNIRDFFVAHIHLGRPGENGPVVVTLFGPVRPGITVTSGSVDGRVTADDLEGPLAGEPLSVLYREMLNGNTYVNLHTEQNPEGEIRGQLRPC